MTTYRDNLPQLTGTPMLTDGGLETTLIFQQGLDLPCFAAFHLLKDAAGTATLDRYYRDYAELARKHQLGCVLEAPTWRASPDWGKRLGYDRRALERANRAAIELMSAIRHDYDTPQTQFVVSGNLGPRGDGYQVDQRMSATAARDYHAGQIEVFADSAADMLCAVTLNYPEEAIGIASGAAAAGMPVALSFTVETDGRLPCGDALGDAISRCDDATGGSVAYYMINCAHPSHFRGMLDNGADWLRRIGGVRANASRKSHAELDNSTELDIGNPQELGADYRTLQALLPSLRVYGGCCGTDLRHVAEIARQCLTTAGHRSRPHGSAA